MARLIGTGNNQVPTNGMLGGMAFQSPEDVQVDKIQENRVDVVSQTDIGTEPNQIPLNQMLGRLAFQDFVSSQKTLELQNGFVYVSPNGNSSTNPDGSITTQQTGITNIGFLYSNSAEYNQYGGGGGTAYLTLDMTDTTVGENIMEVTAYFSGVSNYQPSGGFIARRSLFVYDTAANNQRPSGNASAITNDNYLLGTFTTLTISNGTYINYGSSAKGGKVYWTCTYGDNVRLCSYLHIKGAFSNPNDIKFRLYFTKTLPT